MAENQGTKPAAEKVPVVVRMSRHLYEALKAEAQRRETTVSGLLRERARVCLMNPKMRDEDRTTDD